MILGRDDFWGGEGTDGGRDNSHFELERQTPVDGTVGVRGGAGEAGVDAPLWPATRGAGQRRGLSLGRRGDASGAEEGRRRG